MLLGTDTPINQQVTGRGELPAALATATGYHRGYTVTAYRKDDAVILTVHLTALDRQKHPRGLKVAMRDKRTREILSPPRRITGIVVGISVALPPDATITAADIEPYFVQADAV